MNHHLENLLNNEVSGISSRGVEIPSFKQLDQAPEVVTQDMPDYPAALRRAGREGNASLMFYVDEEGHVRMPCVVSEDSPEFGEAALAAVKQWRFKQPQRNGRPTVAREQWTFQFKRNS